jgi:serine phosphatase RsbU (regulator of sigma subunit)
MPDDSAGKRRGVLNTISQDVARGKFFRDLKDETHEVRSFYITDEEEDRLRTKGLLARWFFIAWWTARNLFLKLTPFRRLLLVAGLVLIVAGGTSGGNAGNRNEPAAALGVIALLLVLALELKDKLLAHEELESGRAVQRAMTPPATPDFPGWDIWLFSRPANEVGGDLVDLMRLGPDRCGIALGDVAGKGLGSALFMVKIQATLRAIAPDVSSPASLAAKVNTILVRDGVPSRFASLLYLEVPTGKGSIRYVNAGHMPPLVLGGEGPTEMPRGNPALGLSAETSFADREADVAVGQWLVLYSDGLTEAQNEAGEFFGLDRLKAACSRWRDRSAREMGGAILQEIKVFSGDRRAKDDLSLAILLRTGR